MRRLLRTDGSMEDYRKPMDMKQIGQLIGAATMDTVMLRHLGTPRHVMIVDDNGWETKPVTSSEGGVGTLTLVPVKPLKPINPRATAMYLLECRPGTSHQIVGDVFICPDEDFEDPAIG